MKENLKSKVTRRNGCNGVLITKILIITIQVNLCCLLHASLGFGTKFTWIIVIKFLLLIYHRSHFLATTWISLLFSQWPSWGLHSFFLQLAVFGLDFNHFCNCILQCWHIYINRCCYLSSCFFYSGRYMQCFTCVSVILLFKFVYILCMQ